MTVKRVRAFLDRIEGDRAVLLVGDFSLSWPVEGLPEGAVEGNALSITIEVDDEATDQSKREVEEMRRRAERGG